MNLSEKEKLNILRQLDRWRWWRSLDDARLCLVCEKTITGNDIKVSSEAEDYGALRAHCPTKNCESIPLDWVLPNDKRSDFP